MNGQRIYPTTTATTATTTTTSSSNSSSRSDIAVPINNEMLRQDYIFSWPLLREIVLNQGRTGTSQLLGTFLPVSEHTVDAVK